MIRAIIFDFDGIITDSEPVHLKMFQKVLSEMGITLNARDYYEVYLGMDDKGCFTTILKSNGIGTAPLLIQSLIQKKTNYLMEYIKNDLFIYPGVVELVDSSRKDYLLAIASGALRHEIEFVLESAGIRSAFNVIVSAEDVSEGKPNPECFNKALEQLNGISEERIKRDECLVIEDSIAGIEAARAAGMRCVAVTNTYSRDRLILADRVVKELSEINLENL
ncbi:MAG: HAD family phosphatase [Nitrospirae bacterium]|nr:HAD family phosphatase [Nitrospirota bacterium]MBI5407326.1 HAD family phosphatase [Nitrospirota bacterium]